MAVVQGEATVTDFPKMKLPRGNFQRYVKSTQELPVTLFNGLIRSQSGSTNNEKVEYQTVKIKCCLHSVFMLALNPILHTAGWKKFDNTKAFRALL